LLLPEQLYRNQPRSEIGRLITFQNELNIGVIFQTHTILSAGCDLSLYPRYSIALKNCSDIQLVKL